MIAIGASNLIGSFVSSFPVTGSISRTAINNSCGVRTPFGGLYTGKQFVHLFWLNIEKQFCLHFVYFFAGVLIILAITVLTPYFYFIPKTCLAAVIICAVLFMVEAALMKLVWKSRSIIRSSIIYDLIIKFYNFLFFTHKKNWI